MSLPVFDVESMKLVVGDSPELIHRLTAKYVMHSENNLLEIHANVETEKWDDVCLMAHRMKSSSRSVGALMLGDMFEQIETACEAGNTSLVVSLDSQLDAAFEAFKVALSGN